MCQDIKMVKTASNSLNICSFLLRINVNQLHVYLIIRKTTEDKDARLAFSACIQFQSFSGIKFRCVARKKSSLRQIMIVHFTVCDCSIRIIDRVPQCALKGFSCTCVHMLQFEICSRLAWCLISAEIPVWSYANIVIDIYAGGPTLNPYH